MSTELYVDHFIEAFPASLAEVSGHPYWEPEEMLSRAYGIRALERFAEFYGLVRIEFEGTSR